MFMNSAVEETAAAEQHKERMDRMYRFQRHFYDATRAYYLLGRDQCIADLKPPSGGSVLEIGCGTGRNLLYAARRYPDAVVYGLDISDEMLTSAASAVSKARLRARVHLAQADATAFDGTAFGRPCFDRVFFSYTLSMIPDWRTALQAAVKLLAPAGELHVVDFGPCDRLPALFRSALYGWLKQFHVTPRTALLDAGLCIAQEQGSICSSSLSNRGYAQHLVIFRPGP